MDEQFVHLQHVKRNRHNSFTRRVYRELCCKKMKRNSTTLANTEYDIIVVGGDIFGVCSAWDAASRGLKVALIEQGDFGHATSANHVKVVHGGIGGLQHLNILRIRESCAERSALLRVAPHLVQPMPFVIPAYGHNVESHEAMMATLAMYDACTFDRNLGISDPKRHVPRSRTISRHETLQIFPQLQNKELTGAAIVYDGQIQNLPRLSLAYVQSAVEAGADAANYTKAIRFLREGDDARAAITGVVVQDQLTGDEYEVRGKLVLNTTSSWAKWLPSAKQKSALHSKPNLSGDAYFVVQRKLTDSHALAIQGKSNDPNAILSHGNRYLFLVPWQDYTLVGGWHILFDEKPKGCIVTDADLQEFIDKINLACPDLKIEPDEVSMWNTGLMHFDENEVNANDIRYGRRSILLDHAKDHGIQGLISLIGVHATTSRGMAEKAINLAFKKLRIEVPVCKTRIKSLYGGHFDTFDGLVNDATMHCPSSIDKDVLPSIIHNHGTNYSKLFRYVEKNPALGKRIGDTMSIKADVVHAVRNEMAYKLGDIIFRRTGMGTASHPGIEALQISSELMATELGWTDIRKHRELAEVEELFSQFQVSRSPVFQDLS